MGADKLEDFRFYLIYTVGRKEICSYIYFKGHIYPYGQFHKDNGYRTLNEAVHAYRRAKTILDKALSFGTANLYQLVVELRHAD